MRSDSHIQRYRFHAVRGGTRGGLHSSVYGDRPTDFGGASSSASSRYTRGTSLRVTRQHSTASPVHNNAEGGSVNAPSPASRKTLEVSIDNHSRTRTRINNGSPSPNGGRRATFNGNGLGGSGGSDGCPSSAEDTPVLGQRSAAAASASRNSAKNASCETFL